MLIATRGYLEAVARGAKVLSGYVAVLFLLIGADVAQAGLGGGAAGSGSAVESSLGPAETQAFEGAVAGSTQVGEDVVGEAPATVEPTAGIADHAPSGTPKEPVVTTVEKTVAPAVESTQKAIDPVVAEVVDQAKALPAATDGLASRGDPKDVFSRPEAGEVAASANRSTASAGRPRSLPNAGGAVTETTVATRSSPDAATTSAPARSHRSLPWPAGSLAPAASQSSDGERDASSNAPPAPLAPLFPSETPATASAAGATGVALMAALLAAFLLLAPRTGRLARPGPILVRPDPCLSLPGRPG